MDDEKKLLALLDRAYALTEESDAPDDDFNRLIEAAEAIYAASTETESKPPLADLPDLDPHLGRIDRLATLHTKACPPQPRARLDITDAAATPNAAARTLLSVQTPCALHDLPLCETSLTRLAARIETGEAGLPLILHRADRAESFVATIAARESGLAIFLPLWTGPVSLPPSPTRRR